MEHIKLAIERAKGSRSADGQPLTQPSLQQPPLRSDEGIPGMTQWRGRQVRLNGAHLKSNRIISHDISDARSKSFDMLRTQVLQSMDKTAWQILGITSPTPDCGKSVIATNLALSIARTPDRAVLLVDLDLPKPHIASRLGLKCDHGLMSVLEGRTSLSNAIIQTRTRNEQLWVLPCEAPILNSSEWLASRPMSALLQEIRRDFKSWTVILDMSPLLTSDDAIAIIPQIDCALFVTAIGITTLAEVKECNKHLDATPIVQVVVNKAPDPTTAYYHYKHSAYAKPPASLMKSVP